MCVGVSMWLGWGGMRVAGLSGACGYSVELPHWSYCSWFDVCWSFGVVGLGWYPPTQTHRNSNTHQTKNNMTNVVIEQNSRKLLMIDTLMSEICWAHKKWNKTGSDIKLVFYSSGFSLQHGYHSKPTTLKLQHTSNQEKYDQCGNWTEQSQAPNDGSINVRNMLST